MTRFVLAFSCFFRLLFGAKLSPKAARYLPEEALRAALPPAPKEKEGEKKADKAEPKPEKKPEPRPARTVSAEAQQTEGALALLALFQREGRLVDFLRESLDDYEDADIGAAVRDIHRGASKVLADYLTIEPVMPGDEDDAVTVPKGFDPGEVRLIGEVSGDPPFKGALRHHGWRVASTRLPKLSEGVDRRVLAPAEVEIGA